MQSLTLQPSQLAKGALSDTPKLTIKTAASDDISGAPALDLDADLPLAAYKRLSTSAAGSSPVVPRLNLQFLHPLAAAAKTTSDMATSPISSPSYTGLHSVGKLMSTGSPSTPSTAGKAVTTDTGTSPFVSQEVPKGLAAAAGSASSVPDPTQSSGRSPSGVRSPIDRIRASALGLFKPFIAAAAAAAAAARSKDSKGSQPSASKESKGSQPSASSAGRTRRNAPSARATMVDTTTSPHSAHPAKPAAPSKPLPGRGKKQVSEMATSPLATSRFNALASAPAAAAAPTAPPGAKAGPAAAPPAAKAGPQASPSGVTSVGSTGSSLTSRHDHTRKPLVPLRLLDNALPSPSSANKPRAKPLMPAPGAVTTPLTAASRCVNHTFLIDKSHLVMQI